MRDRPVAAGKSSYDLIDREKFFDLLKLKPGMAVLDLASGIGLYSLGAAEKLGGSGEVCAVDLWDEGISALNGRIREQHVSNVHTVIADITRPLPLPDAYFDVCLLATVLHDLEKKGQENVLREVARLLKDDGALAVVEFRKIDHGPGPPIHIRISEKELAEKAAGFGYAKTGCEGLGEFTYGCVFRKKLASS
jgi:ubiquinone/menaquinone biosynthesis C-methylase UbiE